MGKSGKIQLWENAILDNSAPDKLQSADGRVWARDSKYSTREDAIIARDELKKKHSDAQVLKLENVSWVYVIKSKADEGGELNSDDGKFNYKIEMKSLLDDTFIDVYTTTDLQRKHVVEMFEEIEEGGKIKYHITSDKIGGGRKNNRTSEINWLITGAHI